MSSEEPQLTAEPEMKKQITSHAKRVENSHNSCGEAAHSHLLWRLLISASLLQASPAVCWCLSAEGKAGEAAGALQMGAPHVTCRELSGVSLSLGTAHV